MHNADGALLSYIVDRDAIQEVQTAGIGVDDFIDEYKTMFKYLLRMYQTDRVLPSRVVVQSAFPDWQHERVHSRDLPELCRWLKQRRKHHDFLNILHRAASSLTDFDSADAVMETVQREVNALAARTAARSHMVDLFHPDTTESMLAEIRARRRAQFETRIKTGLATFDRVIGGLSPQQMVVIIGRTGLGKSWLDLLFVAQAVMQGKSVILYPLEMTLFDTACRLYTLFTAEMFAPGKVLKNLDLQHGNVNTRRVVRFLNILEQKFAGQLHIADMSVLSAPYTTERIEAEVDLLRPDMFWVDYLTLLKSPGGGDRRDYEVVRALSNGIKSTAMRCNTVGGCSAQVNRESLKVNVSIPRLEHISYGDSIGQDADLVFSIARKNTRQSSELYYKLVKNRSGPEIGRTRLSWGPNTGDFHEVEEGEHERTAG